MPKKARRPAIRAARWHRRRETVIVSLWPKRRPRGARVGRPRRSEAPRGSDGRFQGHTEHHGTGLGESWGGRFRSCHTTNQVDRCEAGTFWAVDSLRQGRALHRIRARPFFVQAARPARPIQTLAGAAVGGPTLRMGHAPRTWELGPFFVAAISEGDGENRRSIPAIIIHLRAITASE